MKRLLLGASLLLVAAWAALPPAWDLRSPTRQLLRATVRACDLNDALTGSPRPCREVVRLGDPLRSYAVLREPTGRRRTVLLPLAAVDGIEDPRLREPDAPNPFAAAWRRRHELLAGAGNKSGDRDVALAVNARYSRTQDQLHIHIACLEPDVRASLDRSAASIPVGRFVALETPIRRNRYWAGRFEEQDLGAANPFALVAQGVPGAASDMAIHNIAVARTPLGDGVYILASRTDRTRFYETGAEHLLDPSCSAASSPAAVRTAD